MPFGKKYAETFFTLLNLFVPGSANIRNMDIRLGAVFVFASQILFFLTPFMRLNIVRILYLGVLTASYYCLFMGRGNRPHRSLTKHIGFVVASFILLSVIALNFMHLSKLGAGSSEKDKIIYVLGTRPFKPASTQKMLNMSDDELVNMFNNDIHQFFRRLKTGILKVREVGGRRLVISAGKNQKKIAKRILAAQDIKGIFFACRSTKEEITTIKRYINENGLADKGIVFVSDDYHAFRVLLYSKLNNLNDVSFFATSYIYSVGSFVRRYLIEQALFFLSYISSPVNLSGVVV